MQDLENPTDQHASRIPLSFNQEFLCALDIGYADGPFGPMYHVVRGWRLTGSLDLKILQASLDDVVARHETLHTELVRNDGQPYQRILPVSSPKLVVADLSAADGNRERVAEQFVNDVEASELDPREWPPLRAHLGRFDSGDAVLALIGHHTAIDGWSMRLIMRDLGAAYAGRCAGQPAELPPTTQYQQFALEQKAGSEQPAVLAAREFWRKKLSGAQVIGISKDRQPAADAVAVTATYRFLVDPQLTADTLSFARKTASSPFMVTFTAFNVLLRRMTGTDDVVTPTLTSGRGRPLFDETVGLFFNWVPVRTDFSGCKSLREALDRTRQSCLQLQDNDIPVAYIFGEAPEVLRDSMEQGTAVSAFQVFHNPVETTGQPMGADLRYSQMRRRLLSQPVSSSIPNGTLWTLDIEPGTGMFGSAKYRGDEFDEATIADMAQQFCDVLRSLVTDPDARLQQL